MNKARKAFIAVSVILTLASLWFVPWSMLKIMLRPLPDTVQEQLDDAVALRFDGVILYLEQGGKEEVFTSGWQNRSTNIPADAEALFKIASITKLYVAVVVAKLAQRGELSLDQSLADYLPHLVGKVEYAGQITLRMLVQHRSGIPNYTEAPNYPWHDPSLPMGDIMTIISGQPAEFVPGTRYHYSNTNFYLIGEILKTLGHDYGYFIRQEILDPLDLSQTFVKMDEIDLEDLMNGYVIGFEENWTKINFTGPAGSMIASARDLGVFLRALIDGTLMSESEQTLYTQIYTYEHTGLLPGYSSIARYHKDVDAVVVQFVNTSGTRMWGEVEANYDRVVRIVERGM